MAPAAGFGNITALIVAADLLAMMPLAAAWLQGDMTLRLMWLRWPLPIAMSSP